MGAMKKNLLMFLFCLFTSPTWAQSNDYYYFADTAIGIFADIRDADLPQYEQGKEDGTKWALKNSVHKKQVYTDVLSRLKKFETSPYERIRHGANMLTGGILMLQISNDKFGEFAEKLLNNPKLALEQGTVTRRVAELSENSKRAWEAYSQVGGVITFSLTNTPTSLKELKSKSATELNEKVTNLLITKSESDLLKLHLKKSFGTVLSDDSNASFVDLPAISWWTFLNNNWTPEKD